MVQKITFPEIAIVIEKMITINIRRPISTKLSTPCHCLKAYCDRCPSHYYKADMDGVAVPNWIYFSRFDIASELNLLRNPRNY